MAVLQAIHWCQRRVLAKQLVDSQHLLCFTVLFAIAKFQFDHHVTLFFPAAWVDGHEGARDVDDFLLLLVFHDKAIDFVEQWLHKLVGEVAGNDLLSLLAHGGELLDHRG